jgi:cytochrome c peroxidase
MKKNYLLPSLFAIILFVSCSPDIEPESFSKDDLLRTQINSVTSSGGLESLILPSSLNGLPQDPNNPVTQDKVELGRLLFHETAFATKNLFQETEGTYSCATCHHSKAGFHSGNIQGIGEGGFGFGFQGEGRVPDKLYNPLNMDIQPLRSPTILNSAYQELMLWNGQFGAVGANIGTEAQWFEDTPRAVNFLGFSGVETQAIAAIKVHRMDFNKDLLESTGYLAFFDDVFASYSPSERYTDTTAALAIAAYERSVVASQAPFQKWLRGDLFALSDAEKDGALLFFGKAQCYTCHNGPNLANMDFAAIGFKDFEEDDVFFIPAVNNSVQGRASFTGQEDDMFKFKIPQLYNLVDNGFYGHGSSFRSLRAVIEYKNAGVKENDLVDDVFLDSGFRPLNLSSEEIDKLERFLSNSLYDPNLDRHIPQDILSGNCFPNADPQSAEDLGCN